MKTYKVRVKTFNELGWPDNLHWVGSMFTMSGRICKAVTYDGELLITHPYKKDRWFFPKWAVEIIREWIELIDEEI